MATVENDSNVAFTDGYLIDKCSVASFTCVCVVYVSFYSITERTYLLCSIVYNT